MMEFQSLSPKTQNSDESYVFDANFFINIQDANVPKFFDRFQQAKLALNWNFYISELVFQEIKFVYFSQDKSYAFKKCVDVQTITNDEIRDLKEKSTKSHLFPQDPDISLVVLAMKMKNSSEKIFIITDDYKLSEFAERNKIEVLSCSAFLLKVANNIKDHSLKHIYINLRKRVQKAEIEYVLERKDIYPAHQKLAWLIERAINVSEEKVQFQEEIQECLDEDNAEERIKREIWLAKRFLIGESLNKNQKTEIQYFIPLLNNITDELKTLRKAQLLIIQNQTIQAIELLKEVERVLFNLYISEKAKFISHHTPEILIADVLARTNFLHALSSVQIGGIPEAKRFFDNTAMFGIIARKQSLILMSMLLTALIYVFSDRWKEAIEQYQIVIDLAERWKDDQLWLKCLLGQSIVQFISGKYNDAMKNLEKIRKLLESNPQKSPLILEEFGDTFYALGLTDYALMIYREALEYQLELESTIWTTLEKSPLIEKIRKCFFIQGIRMEKTPKEFSEFMDSIHHLDGKYFEEYDQIMAKIFEINQLLDQPFPIFTDGKKQELQKLENKIDGILDWFDIIDIEMYDEHQFLIVYSPKLGLFGIKISESSLVIPIPENHRVRFKDCQVIIQKPDPTQQEKYLIRAIIHVDMDIDLEIERTMPGFYEILLNS